MITVENVNKCIFLGNDVCFYCKEQIDLADKHITLCEKNDEYVTARFLNTKIPKLVRFHIKCFDACAGNEFLFDQ